MRQRYGLAVLSAGLLAGTSALSYANADRHDAPIALELLLPWGSGPAQAGRHPGVPERRAQGPSAVAMDHGGAVFLLDQVNHRVLRVGRSAQGKPAIAAELPEDFIDLSAGAGSRLVAYSALRAEAWLLTSGQVETVLEVPRSLRELIGLELDPSGALRARTAFQETYLVGTAAGAHDLRTVLHSKREGALLLGNGDGLAVKLDADGRPELLRVTDRAGRSALQTIATLPTPVLAARVIGVSGDLACLRTERAAAGPGFRVQRRVRCLSMADGEVQFERDLPAHHEYLPRRDLALSGGDTPRLAFINPERAGLRMVVWDLSGAAKGGAR